MPSGRSVLAAPQVSMYLKVCRKPPTGVLAQGSDRPGRHPKLCERGSSVTPAGNLGLRKNQKEAILNWSKAIKTWGDGVFRRGPYVSTARREWAASGGAYDATYAGRLRSVPAL